MSLSNRMSKDPKCLQSISQRQITKRSICYFDYPISERSAAMLSGGDRGDRRRASVRAGTDSRSRHRVIAIAVSRMPPIYLRRTMIHACSSFWHEKIRETIMTSFDMTTRLLYNKTMPVRHVYCKWLTYINHVKSFGFSGTETFS